MSQIIQGSPEWFLQRIGKVTASRLKDVIAKTKTGPSASRANYLAELVAERLTGKSADGFSNTAMQWGTNCEPIARATYEAENGVMVIETGLIDHPSIPMTGASPDGLISSDGILEIKCPNTATHIATLIDGTMPPGHMPQVQWQLACTDRKWCDFVSFDPRMPVEMQMFRTRIKREDAMIESYEKEVVIFLAEIESTVSKLIALRSANREKVAA